MKSKAIVHNLHNDLQVLNRKDSVNMNNNLANYIDNEVIREHAYKYNDRYECHLSDLTGYQQCNLIDRTLTFDDTIREIILDHIQNLINERLNKVFLQDKYDAGYKPQIDQVNGELTWIAASKGDRHA